MPSLTASALIPALTAILPSANALLTKRVVSNSNDPRLLPLYIHIHIYTSPLRLIIYTYMCVRVCVRACVITHTYRSSILIAVDSLVDWNGIAITYQPVVRFHREMRGVCTKHRPTGMSLTQRPWWVCRGPPITGGSRYRHRYFARFGSKLPHVC